MSETETKKAKISGPVVAVTGASGFVGQSLCKALTSRGWSVRALVRPGSDVEGLKALGVEIIQGGLREKEAVHRMLEGVQGVFHLAGITGHLFKPEAEYWDMNVTATKELLLASQEHGVTRFIYLSTADVHGHISDPPAGEDAPLASDDIYQITKEHGEQAVLAANGKKGLGTIVIRPAKVYGPGDMRGLGLFKDIADGTFNMYGGGENFIHPIYIDDLVEGIILAYEPDKPAGRAYIMAGEEYVTLNQLARIIAAAAGIELRLRHVPGSIFQAYSSICETFCGFFGVEPPISRRYVDLFIKNHAYRIDRAKNELGYAPKVSLEQGARRTIEWYRAKGLIQSAA